MTDWLRLVAMIFYAPLRGMREVRDRGALMPVIICAYLSQGLYLFAIQWLAGNRALLLRPQLIGANVLHAATSFLPEAIAFVPLLVLVAIWVGRRGMLG